MKNDFSIVKQENNLNLGTGEIGKGIIRLIISIFLPKIAVQEGKAKCIAAQYEKDAQAILAGHKQWKDGALIPALEATSISDLCYALIQNDTNLKAKRLEKALFLAASIIQKIPDEDISDEPMSQTFINHWREEAELMDDDGLRELWANLLVEETCNPYSISPRTLTHVKNLSRKDAETFERLCQLIINSDTILLNYNGVPLNGSEEDVFLMKDAGLIISSTKRVLKSDQGNDIIIVTFDNNRYFFKIHSRQVFVWGYTLTNAGFQIVKYIKNENVLDNMKIIAKELSKQNNDIPISLVKRIDGIPEDQTPEIWNTTQEIGEL